MVQNGKPSLRRSNEFDTDGFQVLMSGLIGKAYHEMIIARLAVGGNINVLMDGERSASGGNGEVLVKDPYLIVRCLFGI